MSNLLSEQGLLAEVTAITIRRDTHNVLPELIEDIVDLIQSQKLAHGEMVIGTTLEAKYPDRYERLRKEQRERNK